MRKHTTLTENIVATAKTLSDVGLKTTEISAILGIGVSTFSTLRLTNFDLVAYKTYCRAHSKKALDKLKAIPVPKEIQVVETEPEHMKNNASESFTGIEVALGQVINLLMLQNLKIDELITVTHGAKLAPEKKGFFNRN